MEERGGERRISCGQVKAAPLLNPLSTPSSWGEEEKARVQILVVHG
jgi:hypothetical protein